MKDYITRDLTESELSNFLTMKHGTASLCFLRGRRRIGKSTLLKRVTKNSKTPCFYFSGVLDEKLSLTLKRFATEWNNFSEQSQLSKFASRMLNWSVIFQDIARHASSCDTSKNIGIFIDEIQWLAKGQSGFVGLFKDAWITLEKYPNIKIIFCGSSTKFFHNYTGGEEKILRGMTTHRDIVPPPFTLTQLMRNITPHWTLEENVVAYMMLGGVPYYWMQVPRDRSFIQSINEMLFTSKTVFLHEVVEILRLEFNKAGTKTVMKILNTIGIHGADIKTIAIKSRLPLTTVIETLESLQNYNIVFKKRVIPEKILKNERGSIFIMHDHYLLFYFAVLKSKERKIVNNVSGQLFSTILQSKKGFYIENFSGKAFENLVFQLLSKISDRTEQIFKELDIVDLDYEVGEYKTEHCQIDIVLFNTSDRLTRFIECRWSHSGELIESLIKELPLKIRTFNGTCRGFVVTNAPISSKIKNLANKNQITLLSLETFFN